MPTWNIDSSHSNIDFKVRHMAISKVRGSFDRFEGSAQSDENGRLQSVEATIHTASIDTNDEQRDGHLRSADFFDVENHPTISFKSSEVESLGGGKYRVTGDLSMHGETHQVTFTAEAAQPITDPYGMQRVGASASGELNRTDWGLKWNQVLEFGGLMVGEEIEFDIHVEAVVPMEQAA